MKVVDFIKKFGWMKAISVSNHFSGVFDYKAKDGEILFSFQVDDLKQYVDAYELVQSCGDVIGFAKNTLSYYKAIGMMVEYEELKKAIALVEEVGNENQD